MTVFVTKTYYTPCPGELKDAIQDDSNITTELIQVISDDSGSPAITYFEFVSALSGGEETTLDNILYGTGVSPNDAFECGEPPPGEVIGGGGEILCDDCPPESTTVWSSERVSSLYQMVNVGGGNGIFLQRIDDSIGSPSVVTFELKSIVAGTNVTITPASDTLTISATDTDTGESNTASNQGAGVGVFDNKNGVDLEFRSLVSQNSILSISLDGANKEIDFSVNEGNIDHDGLLNFVSNEHIDHTSVILTAGAGLSGGGDISTNRSFTVNVQNSIEIDTDTLQLVNDQASPGNDKLYGTNGSGVKGWYDQPTGGGDDNIAKPTGIDYWHEVLTFSQSGSAGDEFLNIDNSIESNLSTFVAITSGKIVHVSVSVKDKITEDFKIQFVKNAYEGGNGQYSGGTKFGSDLTKNDNAYYQTWTDLTGYTFAAGDRISSYIKKSPNDADSPVLRAYVRYD